MLSISARGNWKSAAAYYENLSSDPAGREKGLEDYYSTDAAGLYLGRGASAMGLAGRVAAEEFMDLSAGYTPFGDTQNAGSDSRRAGWDLTFSAPKSVSVIWATADEVSRQKIEHAHNRAVENAIRFMEDHAAFTRRGSGLHSDEFRREKVGLVIAAYRHGTSREQDPQLHTHCMTFNVALRRDGTVGALDSKPLYEWKMAGGAAYRAELARNLHEIGYEAERDGKSFRISHVPKELEDEFSTRRKQIESALNARGTHTAKASEVAALNTRQAKQSIDRAMLLEDWHIRARECSPEWTPMRAQDRPDIQTRHEPLDVARFQVELTRESSTVSEAKLYEVIGIERQVSGGIRDIEQDARIVKSNEATIALDAEYCTRYTTREMRELETEMVHRAEGMHEKITHKVSDKYLEAALSARPDLSAEQKDAISHITSEGDLTALQGWAGSGKSYALGAAKDAWEAEGFRVRGACLSGKAAQELQNGSGIESTTLKRFEMDTRAYTDDQGRFHEPNDKLSANDVLVVDEAGMVGSRQMAGLLEDASQAGAKIVLVGDSRQLQAIEAGAAFRAIEERIGSAELTDIRRQQNAEDRQAVRDLAAGHADAALKSFDERGRVHSTDTVHEAKQETGQAIVDDLAAGKLSIGLTATRTDARDVNEEAREAARENDLLAGDDVAIATPAGERSFAVGDRVLFTRNNKDLDVKNGDLGTVKEIEGRDHDQASLTVELDRGGEREIDTAEYDHLDHGYAVTVHKAQGTTVDRAHVLASENGMSSREWGYVAGSRAREETHVHADTISLEGLAPDWSKSRQKDVSIDYQPLHDLHEDMPLANQKEPSVDGMESEVSGMGESERGQVVHASNVETEERGTEDINNMESQDHVVDWESHPLRDDGAQTREDASDMLQAPEHRDSLLLNQSSKRVSEHDLSEDKTTALELVGKSASSSPRCAALDRPVSQQTDLIQQTIPEPTLGEQAMEHTNMCDSEVLQTSFPVSDMESQLMSWREPEFILAEPAQVQIQEQTLERDAGMAHERDSDKDINPDDSNSIGWGR